MIFFEKQKYNFFLRIVFVFLFSIFISCDVKYNTVDILSEMNANATVEKPTNLFATYDNFKTGIYISWDYYSTQDTTFYIYRSSSSMGNYTLISSKVRNKYFIDYSTLPGSDYYYKVKAVTLTKQGDLSDYIIGKRSGRLDQYEFSDEQANPYHVTLEKRNFLIERSIFNLDTYDGDDIDYFKIDLLENEFLKIDLMKTQNQSSTFNTLNVIFRDTNGFIIASFDKQTLNRTFTVTSVSQSSIIMEVYSDNKESGDYDLRISNFDTNGLIENLTASNKYSSYVRLSWTTKSFIKKYYVQRRLKGTSYEFENIPITTSYLSSIYQESTDIGVAYDRTASNDLEYEYRIYGYVKDGFGAYSLISTGKKLSIIEEDDNDNSFLESQVINDKNYFLNKNLKIGNTGDIDFYKITFLESGKKYKISVKSNSENKITPFLDIFDSNCNIIYHSTNGEDLDVIVNNFSLPQDSDSIYLKVYGIMQTGIYNVEIVEVL